LKENWIGWEFYGLKINIVLKEAVLSNYANFSVLMGPQGHRTAQISTKLVLWQFEQKFER